MYYFWYIHFIFIDSKINLYLIGPWTVQNLWKWFIQEYNETQLQGVRHVYILVTNMADFTNKRSVATQKCYHAKQAMTFGEQDSKQKVLIHIYFFMLYKKKYSCFTPSDLIYCCQSTLSIYKVSINVKSTKNS